MPDPQPLAPENEAAPNTPSVESSPATATSNSLAGRPYSEQLQSVQPGSAAGYDEQAAALSSANAMTDVTADLGTHGAPVNVAVPRVVNVGRIRNEVTRNDAINQSYNAFDRSMTQYLGTPTISNWLTYGQHASRGVGDHIRNMEAAIRTMREGLTIMQGMASLNPATMLRQLPSAGRVLGRVYALATAPGLIGMGVKLALSKAGITPAMILGTMNTAIELTTSLDWPWKKVEQAAEIVGFIGQLVGAIPGVILALVKIFGNLSTGNRRIYESMAPIYSSFLNAANAAGNGMPGKMTFGASVDGHPVDPNGLVSAGFELYSQVKGLSDKAGGPYNASERGRMLQKRNELGHRANMMIVTQEQVGAQPLFDQMKAEFAAIGEGSIGLPRGQVFTMIRGNWADFATRMGYNPSRVSDPNAITPADFEGPNSLILSTPTKGTIQDLFLNRLNDNVVHGAPSGVSPMR